MYSLLIPICLHLHITTISEFNDLTIYYCIPGSSSADRFNLDAARYVTSLNCDSN